MFIRNEKYFFNFNSQKDIKCTWYARVLRSLNDYVIAISKIAFVKNNTSLTS